MKSNLKKWSLGFSMIMLMLLASPLTALAAEEETAASAKFYGTFWAVDPADRGHRPGSDHQGSIQFSVCWNPGGSFVLF